MNKPRKLVTVLILVIVSLFTLFPRTFASTTVIGNNQVEDTENDWGAGTIVVARYQATLTGNLFALKLYCHKIWGDPTARAEIYSDNSGAPDTLLAEGYNVVLPESYDWTVLDGFNIEVTESNYYWIGFFASNYGALNTRETTVDSNSMAIGAPQASAPDPFDLTSYRDYTLSIYGVIDEDNSYSGVDMKQGTYSQYSSEKLALETTLSPTPTTTPSTTPTPTSITQGVISITFDDGTRNQYTTVFPLMEERNIVGTFYIPTADFPDVHPYNKISVSELLQMQNAGNEIGSHSVSHLAFTTLTETQIRQECEDSKTTLQSYGLNINNFAYPYGTGDLSYANTIVGQYYRSARTTLWGSMDYPDTQFELKSVCGESRRNAYNELLDNLKSMIDYTVSNNKWTIFYFHNVSLYRPDVVTWGGIYVQDFTAFLDYAKASGAQILTVNQVLDLGNNSD